MEINTEIPQITKDTITYDPAMHTWLYIQRNQSQYTIQITC
jgi:hypothetical protein